MKKLFFVVLVVMVSMVSSAQFKVGGGLAIGTKAGFDEGGHKLGIGIDVKGDYAFNETWSLSPDFILFFPGSPEGFDVTFWQLNANAHYNFHEADGFNFYGLAGLNYSQVKVDWDMGESGTWGSSDGEVGLNLGAGANYSQFFGELKYDTAFEQLTITIGILFGT